ncbi:hypothetical protein [Rhodococcus sp. IEGM 1379]|uniref:hypothetical protein n=1 Tax=Rhodococcus sp. IEGM 1379 TaxID=3047086 RepID=UPI0024B748A0|nr:hypothetical protein [Rhodococcus sp. IEGM 1379]MDI9914453.1 hypothetical protein [Rhodococcus sp. IEGM 1379]
MSASWVAGTVRARALARRRLGAAGAHDLALCPDLPAALSVLASTPYGHDVRVGDTLGEAQHRVGATLLWHLRVLAGWLPSAGVHALRLLARGFEIANIDERLYGIGGEMEGPTYSLGALDTAWSRLAGASSPKGIRLALSTSRWKDIGGETAWGIEVGIRLAWADRVAALIPEAAGWARAASALLVVRESVLGTRDFPKPLAYRASRILGSEFVSATARSTTVSGLSSRLPRDTQWVLRDVDEPTDLWRAESRWWQRIESDGFELMRRSEFSRPPVVGVLAVLAADAWRVRAALESAARGGGAGVVREYETVTEAFDGVA